MVAMNNQISGGISGAISDPLSPKAMAHAKTYYEEIRHRNDDIAKIAKNTGYSIDQISLIKNYLFISEHQLSDGFRRFDPSFEIAETWQRLSDMPENIQEHDKLLIPHELKEIKIINEMGISQIEAHVMANEDFNYGLESNKFYEKLQSNSKAKIRGHEIISGGITKTNDEWSKCY
jgi:hypothetical protein